MGDDKPPRRFRFNVVSNVNLNTINGQTSEKRDSSTPASSKIFTNRLNLKRNS